MILLTNQRRGPSKVALSRNASYQRALNASMIMRLRALSLLSLTLCLFARFTFAIYVDEAYRVDYHHALLGIAQAHATFFHRPSANSKASLLYTLSESGILGAVNPKDGAVLWRQRLGIEGHNYTGKGILRVGEGSNTVVSILDDTLKVWDATDGRLGWSWRSTGNVKALEILSTEPGATDAVVLSQEEGAIGIARCFSAETGIWKWDYEDTSGDVPHALIFTQGKLFYISLHSALLKGLKIKITALDSTTGKQAGQSHTFSTENEIFSDESILYAGTVGSLPVIVWADKSLKTVKLASILHKQMTTISVPSSNAGAIERLTVHAPSNVEAQTHFLLHFQGPELYRAQAYHVDTATGVAKIAYDLSSQVGKAAFSTSNQGPDVFFVQHTGSQLSLFSSKGAERLANWNVSPTIQAESAEVRDISHAVTEVVKRGELKFSIRSALALSSGDWELVRNGDSLWVRPDGLTGVVAATFTDFPRGEDLAQELAVEGQYNFVSAYVHRLRRHIRDLQFLPAWMTDKYKGLLASLSGEEAPGSPLRSRSDKFGFNKIVVLATHKGRLAALDTGNHGRPIWNKKVISLEPGSAWDVISMHVEGDSVFIRAAKGEFLRVQSSSGKTIEHQRGALITGLDTLAAVLDSQGQKMLIPVNTNGSLGRIPEADFRNGTIVVTKSDRDRLTGWTLNRHSKASLAWQFVPFAGDIQEILHRPVHDPVASIGKALGDRNVLYKYLNPNLILITAVHNEASTATIYLLDSTSGALLYSTSHSDVDLNYPIRSTISENFFAYSLFSKTVTQDPLQIEQQKLKGYQLIVSELYESPYPNDRGPLGSSANFSSTQPLASRGDTAIDSPHVISQTFLIPGPISRMSTTSTLQGITPRSLLCAVPTLNALIAIPRYIVDPRRPVGRDPTAAEMEEGLFRYNAMLDFDPKWSLNHKREFLALSNVITNPSLLESTSLIFAYGDADIFGTRISPIGGFDILGKGFSKLQLVSTVALLAVGTSVLAPFVSPAFLVQLRYARARLTKWNRYERSK